jgi:FAD/FMN-containing dehydrogenase
VPGLDGRSRGRQREALGDDEEDDKNRNLERVRRVKEKYDPERVFG